MRFCTWVDKRWRRPDEPFTTALWRLRERFGLAYKTLFYAYRSRRISPQSAKRIEAFTRGAVRASSLVFLPTRGDERLRPRLRVDHRRRALSIHGGAS